MQTKLTLRMDEKLVEQAKQLAKIQGKSVSQMVADYFVIVANNMPNNAANTIDGTNACLPVTKSLRGLLAGKEVTSADYRDYLANKYQ